MKNTTNSLDSTTLNLAKSKLKANEGVVLHPYLDSNGNALMRTPAYIKRNHAQHKSLHSQVAEIFRQL